MPDARPGAHALGEAGVEQAAVPFGGLMFQLAIQHPRDNFYVAMGMGLKAGACLDDISC